MPQTYIPEKEQDVKIFQLQFNAIPSLFLTKYQIKSKVACFVTRILVL